MGAVSRRPHGLHAWLLQRLSAVYLAGFIVYLAVHFMLQGEHSYPQWRAWLTHPAMSIAGAGFVLAIMVHAWVGLRDIILDYIPVLGVRLLLLALAVLILAGCGLWALSILLLTTGSP